MNELKSYNPSEILQQLTEHLNSNPSIIHEDLITKVKFLLPALINKSLKINNVSDVELRWISKLLQIFAAKNPAVFGQNDQFLSQIVLKLLPYLKESRLRSAHAELVGALGAILGLLRGHHCPAFPAFVAAAVPLLQRVGEGEGVTEAFHSFGTSHGGGAGGVTVRGEETGWFFRGLLHLLVSLQPRGGQFIGTSSVLWDFLVRGLGKGSDGGGGPLGSALLPFAAMLLPWALPPPALVPSFLSLLLNFSSHNLSQEENTALGECWEQLIPGNVSLLPHLSRVSGTEGGQRALGKLLESLSVLPSPLWRTLQSLGANPPALWKVLEGPMGPSGTPRPAKRRRLFVQSSDFLRENVSWPLLLAAVDWSPTAPTDLKDLSVPKITSTPRMAPLSSSESFPSEAIHAATGAVREWLGRVGESLTDLRMTEGILNGLSQSQWLSRWAGDLLAAVDRLLTTLGRELPTDLLTDLIPSLLQSAARSVWTQPSLTPRLWELWERARIIPSGKASALSTLPLMLWHCRDRDHHLPIVMNLLKSVREDEQETLGEILGPLCCVAAGGQGTPTSQREFTLCRCPEGLPPPPGAWETLGKFEGPVRLSEIVLQRHGVQTRGSAVRWEEAWEKEWEAKLKGLRDLTDRRTVQRVVRGVAQQLVTLPSNLLHAALSPPRLARLPLPWAVELAGAVGLFLGPSVGPPVSLIEIVLEGVALNSLRVSAFEALRRLGKTQGRVQTNTTESAGKAPSDPVEWLLFRGPLKREVGVKLLRGALGIPGIVPLVGAALRPPRSEAFLWQLILPAALSGLLLLPDQDHSLAVLSHIAQRLEKNSAGDLVLDYISHIYCDLLINHPSKVHSISSFLHQITRSGPKELLQNYLSDLLNLCVGHLGDPEKEKDTVKALHIINTTLNGAAEGDSLEGFLKGSFLSLMDYINTTFFLKKEGLPTRLRVLRGLKQLLILIGSHVNSVRPKILATLELVLNDKELCELACDVWSTFVRRLDISGVGPILPRIFVDLLPFVKNSATQKIVVEIFSYLIIENRNHLKVHFREIPFATVSMAPECPEMATIEGVLAAEAGSSLLETLSHLLRAIQHESANVRTSALRKLIQVLQEGEGVEGLWEADPPDPILSLLVQHLIVGSRAAGHEELVLRGICLGILGPLDPARLDLRTRPEIHVDRTSEELRMELVSHYLLKAFQAAKDPQAQDRAAYAIQQILKLSHCSHSALGPGKLSPEQKEGRDFWERIPGPTREVIGPFLSSTYVLKPLPPTLPHGPLYPHARSFRMWVSQWCFSLLPLLPDTLDAPEGEVFRACRGVIKDDVDTAVFLLPHLLFLVLSQAGSHWERIAAEFLAVLEDGAVARSEPSELREMSLQRVFYLIDWLVTWRDRQTQPLPPSRRKSKSSPPVEQVSQLLQAIPQHLLAAAAFHSSAYERALKHLEGFIRDERESGGDRTLQTHLHRLQEIYARSDDPDGLAGIATLRKETSLSERLLDCESAGLWNDALLCYDQAVQEDPRHFPYRLGLLQSLLHLGHWETMLALVQGGIALPPPVLSEPSLSHPILLPTQGPAPSQNNPSGPNSTESASQLLRLYGIQAAWQLGKWEELGEFVTELKAPHWDSWEGRWGMALWLRYCGSDGLPKAVAAAMVSVVQSIAAASIESPRRTTEGLGRTALLIDLVNLKDLVHRTDLSHLSEVPELPTETQGGGGVAPLPSWESFLRRLRRAPAQWKYRAPLLLLRGALLSMAAALGTRVGRGEVAGLWLQVAKTARASGEVSQAAAAVLRANAALHSGGRGEGEEGEGLQGVEEAVVMERAKQLWTAGHAHRALAELRSILPAGGASQVPRHGRVWLLLGRWQQHCGQVEAAQVISHLTKAVKCQPKWEKGHFFLGRCYDELYSASSESSEGREKGSVLSLKEQSVSQLCYALKNYGEALMNGHHYIFQSLPRLLTLWFDYGLQYHSQGSKQSKTVTEYYKKINLQMKRYVEGIPAHLWYLCYPQLVSRICHPSEEIYDILLTLLVKVLKAYPHQSLWALMAVTKSLTPARARRANAVILKAKNEGAPRELLDQGETFCTFLLELCNYDIPKAVPTLTLSTSFPQLKRFLRKAMQVIVPLQSSLTVTLPADGRPNPSHQPFPTGVPTIHGMEDTIEVMNSGQRPRKIMMKGSDGKVFPFLCKPKDDLRKDCRMMEFNIMINKLLKKDPACRRRNLSIRTYAVIPLNEECGLIEWVPHTSTLRSILMKYYKALPLTPNNKKLKELYHPRKHTLLESFRDHLIPLFSPPVLHKWLLDSFPEPSAWMEARLTYSRSMAVMSMIGYIVGLGDRHGENILLDSNSGGCVHVDFNCLFSKGLTLAQPEKVPFRLTHNVVDAMGLSGYEGVFRKVCELTLSVLRTNRETLMSVLETFIHDPLVEWSKERKMNAAGEPENEEALKIVKDIDERLQGKVGGGLPLSVEGQVHQQIQSAISLQNLSEMYIGWAPHL